MQISVAPSGEYATIDITAQTAVLAALQSPDSAARAVDTVLAAPQRYAPPVLFALAGRLFAEGRRPEGAFWFYAAQVRARFDANRCADGTVAGAVRILSSHEGAEINPYAFADLEALQGTVEAAVAWDRAAPHEYDHRWINLHGMGAFRPTGDPLSRPAHEWDAIAERTRQEYLRGLHEVVEQRRP